MSSISNLIGKELTFSVVYTIDKKVGNGSGKIYFENSDDYTVYVSWKIVDEKNSLLAGKSRKYFQNNLTEKTFIQEIINSISNYRIGRKKMFANLILANDFINND